MRNSRLILDDFEPDEWPSRQGSRTYRPEFGEEEQKQGPRHGLARQIARRIHREFQVDKPPVAVDQIIAARGLRLIVEPVEGHLSGQLFAETKEIFVNSHERTIGRQRFTMAHELGHWELRHSANDELPADSQGFAGVFENESENEGRSPIEVEANCFAAELLMPSAWLKKERKPLSSGRPNALAAAYGVSREAMFYQLMRCNLI